MQTHQLSKSLSVFLVVVARFADASTQDETLLEPKTFSISGSVVLDPNLSGRDGLPKGIRITAVGDQTRWATTALTNENGQFTLKISKADTYRLWAEHARFGTRVVGATNGSTLPAPVPVDASHPKVTTIVPIRRGLIIEGRIFDADKRRLANVEVFFMRRYFTRRGVTPLVEVGVKTNAEGEFRFQEAAPGGFFYLAALRRSATDTKTSKQANATSSSPYQFVYFPSSDSFGMASPFSTASTDASDLSLDIVFPRATGSKVRISIEKGNCSGCVLGDVWIAPADAGLASHLLKFISKTVEADEKTGKEYFVFDGLSPGNYQIGVDGVMRSPEGSTTEKTSLSRDMVILDDSPRDISIDLPGRCDVTGSVVLLPELGRAGVPASGAVSHLEEESIFKGVKIALEPKVLDGFSYAQYPVSESGKFLVPRLSSGEYFLRVDGMPPGHRIARVSFQGSEVLGNLPIKIMSGGKLEIELGRFTASVGGMVRQANTPVSAGVVVALPLSEIYTDFSIVTIKADGSYSLSGLKPGRYALAALDHVETNAYKQPRYRERLGSASMEVNLTGGAQLSQDLTLIHTRD
jgi:hypothetical protein